jgi:two-component system sensor histidine kinase QseC
MAPMLDALNRLFDRIRGVLDAERRFTADAAHELRTPIAAIKAQAQVAICEDDAALRRHALSAVLEGCDRSAHLVDQLLLLSRLEAGATLDTNAPVDLSAVAKQVLAAIAPIAIRKSQQLELDAPQPCVVMGNAALLASLIRNLADNALRYSPAQARIAVSVRHRLDHIVLSVQDSGPGLPDAHMKRLGERFFRAPGGEHSGSGLGWSIVRRVANAHGASLDVRRSDELGGLKVEVDWADPPRT